MDSESINSWQPPSDILVNENGVWKPPSISVVSYPEDGNELCFQVEHDSYWFAHRNRCILAVLGQFPPGGTVYDIGGGNGFVALGMQHAGHEVVLVEPSSGVQNAVRRGVKNVVFAALQDAEFRPNSIPAAGAFDVVEHIEHDIDFLSYLRGLLVPGGRFYCTVPAYRALWSHEDVTAGHFRRYARKAVGAALSKAGFEVQYITYFFSWLVFPIGLFRVLPYRLFGKRILGGTRQGDVQADHTLPSALSGVLNRINDWEVRRIRVGRTIVAGSSLLAVARKP